jgi:hypothetical protein
MGFENYWVNSSMWEDFERLRWAEPERLTWAEFGRLMWAEPERLRLVKTCMDMTWVVLIKIIVMLIFTIVHTCII